MNRSNNLYLYIHSVIALGMTAIVGYYASQSKLLTAIVLDSLPVVICLLALPFAIKLYLVIKSPNMPIPTVYSACLSLIPWVMVLNDITVSTTYSLALATCILIALIGTVLAFIPTKIEMIQRLTGITSAFIIIALFVVAVLSIYDQNDWARYILIADWVAIFASTTFVVRALDFEDKEDTRDTIFDLVFSIWVLMIITVPLFGGFTVDL